MGSRANKLLERMRNSKTGWKSHDLIRLYTGFGFSITHGSNHDIIKHPDYPHLRTTVPRHNYLATGYVEYAVKLIDLLLDLQKEDKNE